jgi:hypothetical protein
VGAAWGAIGAWATVYVWGFVYLTRKINRVSARIDVQMGGQRHAGE